MQNKSLALVKKHFLLILFLIFYFSTLSYKLVVNVTSIEDWDESLYLQSGLEMFEKQYFLFPVWQGQPWLDKSPLVPFLYASVAKLSSPIAPEVSTRLFTAVLSVVALALLYNLFLRASKDRFISIIAVFFTAYTPIFLQRAQIINLDIFLLIGWLGYVLFFDRFWISLVFLSIGVFSKSLIGFYPVFIMAAFYIYLWWRREIKIIVLKDTLKKITVQSAILASWFVMMFAVVGEPFFRQHIIETHFTRLTKSIEFHFGPHSYYLIIAREQLTILLGLSMIGLFSVIALFKNKTRRLFYSLYLLPWFVFLNFSKSKLFWYMYPAIPQLIFLSVMTIYLFKKQRKLYYLAGVSLVALYVLFSGIVRPATFTRAQVQTPSYVQMAKFAGLNCDKLYVLIDKTARDDFASLEKADLLLTTSKWWGNHPSMVYYFAKPVEFLYKTYELKKADVDDKKRVCLATDTIDAVQIKETKHYEELKQFETLVLFRKTNE